MGGALETSMAASSSMASPRLRLDCRTMSSQIRLGYGSTNLSVLGIELLFVLAARFELAEGLIRSTLRLLEHQP